MKDKRMQEAPAHQHQEHTAYRPDIDGLRAIAVLLVVVFHFQLTAGPKSGFVGVDIFFVISGFLITRIIREQVAAQRFSLLGFWVKRLRRLAPALFVVLSGVALYGAARLLPGDFKQLMHEALAAQFYYANIYFWQNVNYFGLQAGSIYLLHTWSLSVEEQFYILYPLALLAALKYGKRFTPAIVLAAALASFALNIVMVEAKPQATFYLMPTRAWELLLGALITWMPPLRSAWVSNLLGAIGAGLVVAAVALYDQDTVFPGYFALLPTLGGVLLIYAGGPSVSWVGRTLSVAPLVYVGRLSYSLYLVHWPINVFAANELGEGYTLGWRFAMVGLCLGLSALLYHQVENPFRHGKRLASRRAFLTGYGAGLAACVLGCGVVLATNGLPGRLPAEVARLAYFADDKPDDRCKEFPRKPEAVPPPPCAIGTPGQAPTWLIYGDSHAWAARAAIDQWLKNTGSAGHFAFLNSCPPIKGVHVHRAGTACQAMNEQMLALAARDSQIKNVFLVSTWRQAIEGKLTTSPALRLSAGESTALFQRQFASTVQELRSMGKQVYVWEPLPGARAHVPRQLALAALREAPIQPDVSMAEYRADYAFFFTALAENRAQIRASFSPSTVLCGSGACASVVSGNPVYIDNSHLARSGSSFWAKALSAQLRDAVGTP
jgi:peptidoglycan/LPS O-acetylase OafA/YrhL